MKKIEAIVKRESLGAFYRCVRRLGVLGFDLFEDRNSWIIVASNGDKARMRVDFAVPDLEAKETVHAVLEQAHPDGIAILELDPDPPARA